jgi:hypothetical protein
MPTLRTADRSRRVAGGAAAVLAVVSLAGSVYAQVAQSLRIVPLVKDEQVYVTFELTDGYTEEVRAAIASGLKTTYTYSVDLRLDARGWLDRSIGTATVASSVEFDNLRRQFTVERLIDGRLDETRKTESENVVRQWMTTMVRLPLFKTSLLLPNRDYYVRVSASARPSSGSILWPFGSGTSAQTKFTFVR